MVKIAVILAAGRGSRLGKMAYGIPKGFLEIEGKSLIQRSVENLLQVGIEKIYIGTGYNKEKYEEFASYYREIECVNNIHYSLTGSMYTLYNMRERLMSDFLLLESDILYEKKALELLSQDERDDVILVSGTTNSGDEVFVEVDNKNCLVNLSKERKELNSVYGELVGVSKISYKRYMMMCHLFEGKRNVIIDYEYIILATARDKPFYVKKVNDLIWGEVDNEYHWQRLISEVFPRIERNEKD